MKVVPLKPKPYVLIDSGRVTGGDELDLAGQWIYMVDYCDAEGETVHDTMCDTHEDALLCADEWATEYGCRIIDRSTPEPSE